MTPFGDQLTDHIPHLRGLARTLTAGDRSLADDLVQETLLKALRASDQFEPGTNLRAWLSVILRNHFLSVMRNRKRRPEALADDPAECLAIGPPQEGRLEYRAFQEAFGRLSPAHRAVLVAVALEGKSYEESAELFRVEVGTIKSRVSRARSILKRQLLGEQAPRRRVSSTALRHARDKALSRPPERFHSELR